MAALDINRREKNTLSTVQYIYRSMSGPPTSLIAPSTSTAAEEEIEQEIARVVHVLNSESEGPI